MDDEGPTAADDVLSSIADELYGGSPADFTARRGARADQIKRDGDPALAATIRGWRKPSVGAWLVNLLARARPDDLDRLVDLGEELRAAQAAMDGDRLRALAKQRLEMLRDLDTAAADLARDAGQGMSDAIQRQVQSTLQAALADPQAADAVRAGHLATALEVTGFGSVDLSDAVAVPTKARAARSTPPAPPGDPASTQRATKGEPSGASDRARAREQAAADRAAAKDRLAAARAEAADATAEAGRARARWKDSESALATAQSRLATQQARLSERERALEQARADAEAADEAAGQAQAERDARERELQEARARREAADAAVRELLAGGA